MAPNRVQGTKKAPVVEVPPAGKDPAERKRALNVLAQRRYRQRRKEHVKKLEAQLTCVEEDGSEAQRGSSAKRDTQDTTTLSGNTGAVSNGVTLDSLFKPTPPGGRPFMCDSHPSSAEYSSVPYQDSRVDIAYPEQQLFEGDPFAAFDGIEPALVSEGQGMWDTDFFMPSLDGTSTSERTPSSHSGGPTWSLPSSVWGGDSPGTASGQLKSGPSATLGQQDVQHSFPDEAYLDMPELALLRGCMSIARRMNIEEIMWSLSSTSPFTLPGVAMTQFTHLPINLRPTWTQMTIPHHPVVDLLPWPSARDKMIKVLSQPPEMRPPGAASPMALVEFVYDLEDSAEGVRLSGNDPYSGQNWEVGEKLFRSWWWMLDGDIVRRSNELRALRGAPMLGSGSILGEVP